jgi:hypothetical protein
MSILCGDGGMLNSTALGLGRERRRERKVERVCVGRGESVEVVLK